VLPPENLQLSNLPNLVEHYMEEDAETGGSAIVLVLLNKCDHTSIPNVPFVSLTATLNTTVTIWPYGSILRKAPS